MALISHIDGEARLVYLDAGAALGGVITFHPVDDLFREYRTLRRTDEGVRRYRSFMEAVGNAPKGGGKFTPRYLLLLGGTKLVIPDGVSEINIVGELLTDDQTTPFDTALVTGPVVLNYTPPTAEVIQVSTSGNEYSLNEIAGAVWAHGQAATLDARMALVTKILRNKTVTNPSNGTMTVYDDDGTTPLLVAPLFEDAAGTQTYRGQGADHRGRLQ